MIKNPAGDSLSKAPNLVDLFANRKDAAQQAVQPADAGKTASIRKTRREILPMEPAVGKSDAGTKPSFQARVKESRAKLAAKSHKFFPQGKAPETVRKDANNPAKPAGAMADANESSGAARGAGLDHTADSAARKQVRAEKESSRPGEKDGATERQMDAGPRSGGHSNASPETQGTASAEDASATAGEPAASIDSSAAYRSEGTDTRNAAAADELKAGLESLGISVTREQLDDPVFLADMLEMLQNMAIPLTMESASVQAGMPGPMEADPADGLSQPPKQGAPAIQAEIPDAASPMQSTAAIAAGTTEPAKTPEESAVQSGEPVEQDAGSFSRKEAAAMIRDRISDLTSKPSDESGAAAGHAAKTASTTPGAWQGVAVRPQGEFLGADPLPMGDLDRLRVLQASALQANVPTKENAATLALESDGGDSAAGEDGEISYLPSADESDAAEGDADPGPYGRKEETSKNPDFAVRKDPSLLSRDGAQGSQFTNSLDLARAPEHRSAVQREWSPHQPAFEKSVLDQISRKMSGIGLKSGEELSIQLAPENLGKVRISLEMKEGVMSARIAVENDSVRQVMESNLAGLRESLEAQGVKLQGLDVSVDQRHGSLFNPDGSNAESFFQRKGRGEGGSSQGGETAPFESAPESDTGRRLGYNTLEYIG